MRVSKESTASNSVPADAVIRREHALFRIIRRKAPVGGILCFCKIFFYTFKNAFNTSLLEFDRRK